jgi:hypothetical protein
MTNATNNILPDVWGPHGWKFMHFVALGYPDRPDESTRKQYQEFFESFQHVLPCQSCATHYQESLQRVPVSEHLKDRDTLLRWTFDLHNDVNKHKGKSVLSYDEALKLYTERQYPLFDYLWKLLVLLVILVLVYVYVVK